MGESFRSRFADAKARLDAGDLAGALAAAAALQAEAPGEFDALMLLADVHGRLGDVRAELHWAELAVARDPRNAAARLHVARRRLATGDARKALRHAEAALSARPDWPEAAAAKAVAFEMQDKPKKVHAAVAPFLPPEHGGTGVHVRAGGAPNAAVAAVRLRALLRDEDWDAAVRLGEAVRADAAAPADLARRQALFALVRAHDRAGDPDAAAAVAREANDVARRPWSADAFDDWVDRMLAAHVPEALAALPAPAAPSDRPVFIVGMPRCGSTLIERALHAHPRVHGAGELGTLDVLVPDLRAIAGLPVDAGTDAVAAALDAEGCARAQDAYLETLRGVDAKADRVVNKELYNLLHLPLVARICPAAPIVHVVRDAADTGLSCWLEPLPMQGGAWASDLEDVARYRRATRRIVDRFRAHGPNPWLDVRYEDLVREPEPVLRALLAHVGVDWDDAVLRPHEVRRQEATISRDQVTRPMHAGAVDRARRYAAHVAPLLALREEEAGLGAPWSSAG